MKLIRHRVNTLADLKTLDLNLGAEFDLRSQGDQIILNHDPFLSGDSLEAFATEWKRGQHRGTLILNPKEDGLEKYAMEILKKHGIDDYFFIDLPLPAVVRLTVREKISKVAIRVSEYETLESAFTLAGKAEWIWLDCFTGQPLELNQVKRVKEKFRLCLVSPELHAYPASQIQRFKSLIPFADAVCTKHPELWQSF